MPVRHSCTLKYEIGKPHGEAPNSRTVLFGETLGPVDIRVSYKVMTEMYDCIAQHRPERGGFLFGGITGSTAVVKGFLYDDSGMTSSTSYYPSGNSSSMICNFEASTMQSLIGVVHSHPAGMDRPSGPDIHAMDSLLEHNPSIGFVVTPIITSARIQNHTHEKLLSLDDATKKISFFIKGRNCPLSCPRSVSVFEGNGLSATMPARDVQYVMSTLSLGTLESSNIMDTEFRGKAVIMASILARETTVTLLFPPSYPVSCPSIIVSRDRIAREVTEYEWSTAIDSKEMLLHLTRRCIAQID